MSQLKKKKPEHMFGLLSKIKDQTLRVLFPNKWGGTNYYHYEHRAIMFINNVKRWCNESRVFLKFWKIPFAISDFKEAVDHSFKHIDSLYDQVNDRENSIQSLIESLVEERFHSSTPAKTYKQCYREIFMAYSDYDEDNKHGLATAKLGGLKLQEEYLTEDESNLRWELGYEHQREAMCGCYDDYHDLALYNVHRLKQNGFLKDKGVVNDN
tara:strand:- start:26 stop:658 length:633 start_codon:yes stop_codon:yes gene_type:complete